MSHAWERHARYYLEYAESHSEDWAWFDREWPQIKRAWQWINKHQERLFIQAYVEHLSAYLELRGLWHETLDWAKQELSVITEETDQIFSLVRIGNAYEKLGQLRQAHEY